MGMNPRGRSRGRNHNNFNNNRRFNNGPNRNTVYDSIGPAGRLRGTAFQLMEKYLSAAKELMASDRVAAENCLQHADHYMRINAMAIAAEGARFAAQPQPETENANANAEIPAAVEVIAEPVEREVAEEVDSENQDSKEPDLADMMKTDLSVPVAAMAENADKPRRGRPVVKKESVPADGAVPVVIKRRGRPAKKAPAAEE